MKKVILITAIVAFASCKKTTNNNTTNNNYYSNVNNYGTLTGNIQGVVSLYDTSGNKITTPSFLAGDTVAITNNNTGITYKTTTNSTGTYLFSNLSAGTYSFTASKQGYGLVKAFGFEFVGGGTTYRDFILGQIPKGNIITAQAVSSAGVITINGTTTAYANQVMIFAFTSSSVSAMPGNYLNYYPINSSSSNTFTGSISATLLYESGFTSGSTVYFAVYLGSTRCTYLDPITGLLVCTALSNTPVVVSAIVP